MKIVLIGAGSHCFGFGTVVDVLRAPALRGRGIEVALVDTDPGPLNAVLAAAHRLRDHLGADIELTATTDRRQALPDAAFVVVSVARRRWELWEQDFRVPLAHGFRHVLGENGGPGAVFHALRSLELILPICRDIEALCPNALMLNFTNPEARVLHAICHLTRVRAAGLLPWRGWRHPPAQSVPRPPRRGPGGDLRRDEPLLLRPAGRRPRDRRGPPAQGPRRGGR